MATRNSYKGHSKVLDFEPWTAAQLLTMEMAEQAGMGVDDTRDGPVFYEVKVDFMGLPGNLGALMGAVREAIKAEFRRYGVRPAPGFWDQFSGDCLLAGNFDQCLGYLLRWVSIDTGEDD